MKTTLILFFIFITTVTGQLGSKQNVDPYQHKNMICEITEQIPYTNVTKVLDCKIQLVSGIHFWLDYLTYYGDTYHINGIYTPWESQRIRLIGSYLLKGNTLPVYENTFDTNQECY